MGDPNWSGDFDQVLSILARNRRALVKLAILSRGYLINYHRDTIRQYSYCETGDGLYAPLKSYYLGWQNHRDEMGPFGPGPAIIDTDYELWMQFGQMHRADGPAHIKFRNGKMQEWEWWFHNLRHRIGGPAAKLKKGKTTILVWYRDGEKCRLDGPALITRKRGEVVRREWYEFGKRHRVDGPAIVGRNFETYYLFGCLHRTDGPAHRCTTPCRPGIWHCRGRTGKLNRSKMRKHLKRKLCQWTESWFCHGKLHRFWDWAVISSLGEKIYYCRGEIHRPPGPEPAMISVSGKRKWYRKGRLHRPDGPAVIGNFMEFWYRNGKMHRPELGPNGGPAILGCYGDEWIQRGFLFRENGPADEINGCWSHGIFASLERRRAKT